MQCIKVVAIAKSPRIRPQGNSVLTPCLGDGERPLQGSQIAPIAPAIFYAWVDHRIP